MNSEQKKLTVVSSLEFQDIVDTDYGILVEETALLLILMEGRKENYTMQALCEQFARNVQYVAELHKSIVKH